MAKYDAIKLDALLGKRLKAVTLAPEGNQIAFVTTDGEIYELFDLHHCFDGLSGELDHLVGAPIVEAHVVAHDATQERGASYCLATAKGGVRIKADGKPDRAVKFDLVY